MRFRGGAGEACPGRGWRPGHGASGWPGAGGWARGNRLESGRRERASGSGVTGGGPESRERAARAKVSGGGPGGSGSPGLRAGLG
ncbi:MAG: hypothetical protein LBT40_05810, partial [Deltaproteobacteria bacterium]|nr:hypothetical protein [Deltaproteobacteria bacterium]